ncbi:hypothetical protein CRUP_002123, partial [Coryphaenoides rupestris]
MEDNESNFTEPPLALDVVKDLDVFGVCLYAMMTFMASVSLLLYLEQCVYIYRKLPYPKKTTIMWINGAAPTIATMSCFGMWIPRAVIFTDMRFSGQTFRINTGPCCCCCVCLPRVPLTRRMIFWMKLGALQYAILKTALSILSIILWTNGNFDPSDDNESNFTVDPACLQEPPLALDVVKDLDVFGVCLYAMMTFMASVSLLLYLEQCVYIYRKLPYPKKTTIMWINGAAPTIATMSCFGMWIPRAVIFTDMVSNCYFAAVVYKMLVLLIEEFGGTEAFLQRFSGQTFRINTGPCCCCCVCLPRVPLTRRMIFWMKLGALQYAILKTALSILSIILWTNGNFDPSDLVLVLSQLQTSIINILSLDGTIPCSPPFLLPGPRSKSQMMICEMFIITLVTRFFYRRTYDPLPPATAGDEQEENLQNHHTCLKDTKPGQLVLVLSQLQTSIINILSLDGTIPCSPPFSSQARGAMLSQQMMICEMFIITLVTRFFYRRTYDPLPPATA